MSFLLSGNPRETTAMLLRCTQTTDLTTGPLSRVHMVLNRQGIKVYPLLARSGQGNMPMKRDLRAQRNRVTLLFCHWTPALLPSYPMLLTFHWGQPSAANWLCIPIQRMPGWPFPVFSLAWSWPGEAYTCLGTERIEEVTRAECRPTQGV